MDNSHKKIYILHGWTYTLSGWDALVKLLREKGYEVVVLRVPGLTAESKEIWDLDKYTEWFKTEIGGDKDINIVAHSNGGRIAISYLNKYGEGNVASLVLIDSAGIVDSGFSNSFKKRFFYIVAKIGKKIFRGRIAELLKKILYKILGVKDYNRAPENMKETMKNLINLDLSRWVEKIKVPTLIVWGEKDNATPISDGQLMSGLIRGSVFHSIKDAGHSPHMTNPEQVFHYIADFLK